MLFSRKPPPTTSSPSNAMELPTTTLLRDPAASSPPVPGSNCVLLVDDEPKVLAVGKAVLGSAGFEVICASSGEIAIELVRHAADAGSRYAAIVLDLTMPGGPSGFDVLASILEIDSNAAIVACSGYFQSDARELCRAIGFYDVLAKPYNLDALCTVVRRAIARAPMPAAGVEDPVSLESGMMF
ncbi:MAG: response regulator [Verrucomicrobiaceae bacterium]|nr:response regulator [Verrucomicrobiaceae bacterium]